MHALGGAVKGRPRNGVLKAPRYVYSGLQVYGICPLGYVHVTNRGRCDLCPKNAPHALVSSLGRMNEHRGRYHEGSPPLANLLGLQTCLADKAGKWNSLVEHVEAIPATTDFRNASLFEAKVGLLKYGILFCEGEQAGMGPEVGAWFPKPPENPHHKAVVDFFLQADTLCSRMGSTHCRQQALRDCEGNVSPKCFHPVQPKTAKDYAVTVARFIYFCERADWSGRRTVSLNHTVMDVLRTVLLQPCVLITQTFITRFRFRVQGLWFKLYGGEHTTSVKEDMIYVYCEICLHDTVLWG
jgi:hypothetical protein